jgi:hypothetical protein
MSPLPTKRVLAYLDRIAGEPIFLGAFEGDAMQVSAELKRRWPNAYRTQRIDLREVPG